MEQRKVALITGASSGIGQGIAQVLAEQGYDLAITYGSNTEGAEKTRAMVEALGARCEIYQGFMEDRDTPTRIVNAVHKKYGRIDAVICNANRDRRHSILTITADDIDFMMNSNLRSYLLCASAAARHMVRDGVKGSIVFITSTRFDRAYQDDMMYGALKAAITRACKSMAIDLAPHGIRVNCVAPGATATREGHGQGVNPLTNVVPLGRLGTPRDNGELVAFLISEKASYITGTAIVLDGGLSAPGTTEGWAPAFVINKDFTKRHYDAVMAATDEEEE